MPVGARSSRAAGIRDVGRQARTNDRSEARARSSANRYIEIDRAHAPEGNFDLGDICVPLSRPTKKRLMNECEFAHGPAFSVTARQQVDRRSLNHAPGTRDRYRKRRDAGVQRQNWLPCRIPTRQRRLVTVEGRSKKAGASSAVAAFTFTLEPDRTSMGDR